MKRVLIFALLLGTSHGAPAQSLYQLPDGRVFSRELIDIFAYVVVIYLVSWFVLTIIKSHLDFRLKSKMIEKDVSDKVVEQFLQPTTSDAKSQAIKWFLNLSAIALGLTAIRYSLPIGIHSLAIMSFALALSFLGYYYYIKRTGQ